MDPRRRSFVRTAGAMLILAGGCGEPPASPGAGEILPELEFARLDGSAASLADHSGRAVVLNLWATWCAPCRAEMPSLQRLADAFAADELNVIGISVDDDLNLVREFLLRHAIRFPVYADSLQPSVRSRLNVRAYPMTWLVRPDRRIAEVIVGERAWDSAQMVARIGVMLAVRPQPPGREGAAKKT